MDNEVVFSLIGGGSWATAQAKILCDNGHHIHWWMHKPEAIQHLRKKGHNRTYLPSVYFNREQVTLHESIEDAVQAATHVLITVPSAHLESTLHLLSPTAFRGKKVISAVKGLLPGSNLLLNEFMAERFQLSLQDYISLMGPCHAEEVANEKLSYLTFSAYHLEDSSFVANRFANDYIRTIANENLWGSQYAAILKNVYAVGAGIAHGLEYGDNFFSVYIANATNEMIGFLKKVLEQKAGRPSLHNYTESVYLGDLLVTCYSLYSRNRTFGTMIGNGYSVKVAQLEMKMVAEGFNASKGIYEINLSVMAEMPIATSVYRILHEGLPATDAFAELEKIFV